MNDELKTTAFQFIVQRSAFIVSYGVDAVEYETVYSLLAEVARDLRACVVRAEGLPVDVPLEDVAENVGVDLVGAARRRVVQIPRVAVEEAEELFKSRVGHGDGWRALLGGAPDEEAAAIGHDAAAPLRTRRACVLRFGEALEEERAQKLRVVTARAARAAPPESVL